MMNYLRLVRYPNLLMVALTLFLTKYALIHSYVVPSFSDFDFVILTSSILFITAGGYVINDIFDVKTDKINKPKKVIITEHISKRTGWTLYSFLNVIGLSLGFYISFKSDLNTFSFYFFGSIILLFIYSKFLKRLPLVGNIAISILIALTIFLIVEFQDQIAIKKGMFTNLTLSLLTFYYLVFSFITTLVREIIKDIEDVNGDHSANMKTLPIILGIRRTKNIALGITMMLFLFLILFLKDLYSYNYTVGTITITLITALTALCIYKMWLAKNKIQFHQVSQLLKFIMLIGILSMASFKFI